jgi:Putative Flp pilus-assembly TadE/G-like
VRSETEKRSARLAAQFARMRALFSSFRSNTRANVAVISAVSALPLITAIGCVVDYTTAAMIRTKLQAAADAATLAVVSANSPLVATAKAMTSNGTCFRRLYRHDQFLQREFSRDDRLRDPESDRQRDQDRHGDQRDIVLYLAGPHVLHGRDRLQQHCDFRACTDW